MPYTQQDCLDKIQDISTNSQKCNKVVRALGVNVSNDASLADLSTNIASIDTTFHPDYELPWIMADGSSGLILDIQTTKNRSVEFKGRLVPMYDTEDNYASNHGLVGTKWVGGACWGIDQMRYNTRMRYREDKSPGLSADKTNNVGTDNVWSETLNPWWVTTTWKCSYYDTTSHRVSQYGPNSSTGAGWTHAASGSAQASTSGYNLTPIGVLNRFYVTSKTTWQMENFAGCAKKGTICESLKTGNGAYNETWTDQITFTPVLHWDCSTNKYRPCMRRADSSTLYYYTSFPITANLDYDDGTDHMYYYELDKGIIPLEYPTSTETYEILYISTDIPYSTSYTYILKADVYSGTGNFMAIMNTTGEVHAGISTYSQSIGSNPQCGMRVWDGGNNKNYQYSQFYNNPREYCFIAKIQFGATLEWWQYDTTTSYTSASKLFSYTLMTNTGTRRDGDRGNMSFLIGNTDNTTSPRYRFYWCYILDENNNVIHYLVPVKHNNAYKLYDVITKKLYIHT